MANVQTGGVTVEIDTSQVDAMLGVLREEAPFAIATALNRTAEDGLYAVRQALPHSFTLRQPGLAEAIAPRFLPAGVRARKDRLTVELEPTDRGSFLSGKIVDPFERGIPKTSDRLGRIPAVPTNQLRITKGTVIPRALYPVNLGLQPRLDPSSRTTYYALGKNAIKHRLTPFRSDKVKVGKRGTFEIALGNGRSIVLQRQGSGKAVVLWYLQPVVRRPPVLHYNETMIREINTAWPRNIENAVAYAIRTAEARAGVAKGAFGV